MDALTNMICFPRDQFYMVITLSLVVIGLVLYHVNYVNTHPTVDAPTFEPPPKLDRHSKPLVDRVDQAVDLRVGQITDNRMMDRLRTYDALTPPFRRNEYNHGGFLNTTYTQGFGGGSFVQMGYLSDGKLMLPLFGRRLHHDRYEYYVVHQDNPLVKIPIGQRNQKELYTDDKISVKGYPNEMQVNIYSMDYPSAPLVL